MSFKVFNPKEDSYGNAKENIFLAFDEEGNFLGNSYVYPKINHHQTYKTPYTLFIDVSVVLNAEEELYKEVKQKLFESVYSRAKELRKEKPDLRARIYSGFDYDEDKMEFYKNNGFEEDYTIFMESDITNISTDFSSDIDIIELDVNSDMEFEKYKEIYDEIFVSPIEREKLIKQFKKENFRCVNFYKDKVLLGSCTIFKDGDFGHIETVFVTPNSNGKGVSKEIMKYIVSHFKSFDLNKAKLEVWKSNERAVKLYEKFGFKEVGRNMMFPMVVL